MGTVGSRLNNREITESRRRAREEQLRALSTEQRDVINFINKNICMLDPKNVPWDSAPDIPADQSILPFKPLVISNLNNNKTAPLPLPSTPSLPPCTPHPLSILPRPPVPSSATPSQPVLTVNLPIPASSEPALASKFSQPSGPKILSSPSKVHHSSPPPASRPSPPNKFIKTTPASFENKNQSTSAGSFINRNNNDHKNNPINKNYNLLSFSKTIMPQIVISSKIVPPKPKYMYSYKKTPLKGKSYPRPSSCRNLPPVIVNALSLLSSEEIQQRIDIISEENFNFLILRQEFESLITGKTHLKAQQAFIKVEATSRESIVKQERIDRHIFSDFIRRVINEAILQFYVSRTLVKHNIPSPPRQHGEKISKDDSYYRNNNEHKSGFESHTSLYDNDNRYYYSSPSVFEYRHYDPNTSLRHHNSSYLLSPLNNSCLGYRPSYKTDTRYENVSPRQLLTNGSSSTNTPSSFDKFSSPQGKIQEPNFVEYYSCRYSNNCRLQSLINRLVAQERTERGSIEFKEVNDFSKMSRGFFKNESELLEEKIYQQQCFLEYSRQTFPRSEPLRNAPDPPLSSFSSQNYSDYKPLSRESSFKEASMKATRSRIRALSHFNY